MNKFAALIATAAFAAALPAFAESPTPDVPTVSSSTVTRAQVLNELRDAQRSGAMRVWSTSYNHMAAARSLKTRDEVRSEVLAEARLARGQGSATMYGEDSGSFALSPQPMRVAPTRLAGR